MSVLKQKRTTSKAEFINTANQIYVETLNFLTRLSARYSRLIAEPVAKLAGEIIDHAEKANSIFPSDNQRIEMRKAHLLEARASPDGAGCSLDPCLPDSEPEPGRGLYHFQGEPGEVTGCNGKAG